MIHARLFPLVASTVSLMTLLSPHLFLASADATTEECDLTSLWKLLGSDSATACVGDSDFLDKRIVSNVATTATSIQTYCASKNCAAFDKLLHAAYPGDCFTSDNTKLWANVFKDITCFTKASTICSVGESEMSVEGTDHIFCITGKSCSGTNADGVCPGPDSKHLPYGSQCSQVRTGVYGCRAWADAAHTTLMPNPDSLNCAPGSAPVSVVGDKAYCVKEPVCVHKASSGNCPTKADGLAADAVCSLLSTNVYGCTLG